MTDSAVVCWRSFSPPARNDPSCASDCGCLHFRKLVLRFPGIKRAAQVAWSKAACVGMAETDTSGEFQFVSFNSHSEGPLQTVDGDDEMPGSAVHQYAFHSVQAAAPHANPLAGTQKCVQ